jgi:hypothetical protein
VNCGLQDSRKSLVVSKTDLIKIQQRLEREKSELINTNLVNHGLTDRIESLHVNIIERTQKSPNQAARDVIRDLKKKKTSYDKGTGKLVKAFNAFVDQYLAAMLAAEELGGPVVGDMLDIDELSLENGLSSQGRTRKVKGFQKEDRSQRRIDEIWGKKVGETGGDESDGMSSVAAAEMRDLTEQLLNGLVEANSGDGDAYIQLERESAATRFLVRSKVAHFHPRDARRLRLIDFGRDLDE